MSILCQECINYKGKFNKSDGEEYQIVKRGMEYHGCGKEYNVEKRKRGGNIISRIILRLLGRISSGEKGNAVDATGRGGAKIFEFLTLKDAF